MEINLRTCDRSNPECESLCVRLCESDLHMSDALRSNSICTFCKKKNASGVPNGQAFPRLERQPVLPPGRGLPMFLQPRHKIESSSQQKNSHVLQLKSRKAATRIAVWPRQQAQGGYPQSLPTAKNAPLAEGFSAKGQQTQNQHAGEQHADLQLPLKASSLDTRIPEMGDVPVDLLETTTRVHAKKRLPSSSGEQMKLANRCSEGEGPEPATA